MQGKDIDWVEVKKTIAAVEMLVKERHSDPVLQEIITAYVYFQITIEYAVNQKRGSVEEVVSAIDADLGDYLIASKTVLGERKLVS